MDINRLSMNDSNDGNGPVMTAPPGFEQPSSAAEGPISDGHGQRQPNKSSSFNNLALALGTGLAECMDDSTSERNSGKGHISAKASSGLDDFMAIDNYARQSRHAVTRLVGHPVLVQQQQQIGPPYSNSSNNQVRFTAAMMAQQSLQQQQQQHQGSIGQQLPDISDNSGPPQAADSTALLNANSDFLLQIHPQQHQQLLNSTTTAAPGGNAMNGYNPLLSSSSNGGQQQQSLQSVY